MGRLTSQTAEQWTPLPGQTVIGVLDRTVEEMATEFPWAWDEVEEDGLGQTF